MQSKTGGISDSLNIIHNSLDATLFQPSLYLRGKALKSHTQIYFNSLVSNYESVELHFFDKLKSIAKMILQQQSDIDIIVSAQKETTTGQNGHEKTKAFHQATPITGIILTKLDGY
ncbi:hypothetical protein ACTFIW_008780 [Dictyostelium discoideum]